MGCWDETCMLSNLPIGYNDSIVAYLISYDNYKDQKDFSGTCYTTDKSFPISLPIKCKYNDYGSIQDYNENDLAIKHLEYMFKFKMPHILEMLQDDNLHTESIYGNEMAGVGLIMIHEEIYKTAINEISTIRPITTKKEIQDEMNYNLSFLDNQKSHLGQSHRSSSICIGKDHNTLDKLTKLILSVKDRKELVEEATEKLFERMAINNVLARLRKNWLPHSGKGSQNSDIQPYLVLANAIRKQVIQGKEPIQLYYEFMVKR